MEHVERLTQERSPEFISKKNSDAKINALIMRRALGSANFRIEKDYVTEVKEELNGSFLTKALGSIKDDIYITRCATFFKV